MALGLGRRYDRGADSGRRASCPVVKRLTETRSHCVAADDGTLSRLEFLAAVRDRIRDDLKAANRILESRQPHPRRPTPGLRVGAARPIPCIVVDRLEFAVAEGRQQKTAAPSRICIGEFRTYPAMVVGWYQPILAAGDLLRLLVVLILSANRLWRHLHRVCGRVND